MWFFFANTGLFENRNIPWYCFFNVLSCKTGLNKIKKLFRTVHRGQRSKKVIFGKIRLFQSIFLIFSAESTPKRVFITIPYSLVTAYVIDSMIIDHTLGQRSNFVHPIPLSIVFLIFNSYPCLFEFPFFPRPFMLESSKTHHSLRIFVLYNISELGSIKKIFQLQPGASKCHVHQIVDFEQFPSSKEGTDHKQF